MCVIAYIETARLSEHQVTQMYDANDHGGGAAWREDGVVKWSKGLNRNAMVALAAELPLPHVLHFRIASANTSKSALACHPFPIDAEVTLGYTGETDGSVLFHNGFWHDWKNKILNASFTGHIMVPSGPWSDSRGLAWAAHNFGLGLLEMTGEKVITFGTKTEGIQMFGDWHDLDMPDGSVNLVSNKGWMHRQGSTPTKPYIMPTQVTSSAPIKALSEGTGGSSHATPFRTPIDSVANGSSNGTTVKKGIQVKAKSTPEEGAVVLEYFYHGMCITCGKKSYGTEEDNQFFCMQCWSEYLQTKDSLKAKINVLKGLCNWCKTISTSQRTVLAKQWICNMCWQCNGRPMIAPLIITGLEEELNNGTIVA